MFMFLIIIGGEQNYEILSFGFARNEYLRYLITISVLRAFYVLNHTAIITQYRNSFKTS